MIPPQGFVNAADIKKIFVNYNPFACCELIAAINTTIFCGSKKPNKQQIEPLIDNYGCRYGSVISIQRLHNDFNIKTISGPCELDWIANNLPVGLLLNEKRYGRHKVLVVGVNGTKLYITNFGKIVWQWDKIQKIFSRLMPYPEKYQLKEK